jgi:hypothetical protein
MLNLYGVGATNGKSKRYQSILSIAFALLVLIFAVASSSASSSVQCGRSHHQEQVVFLCRQRCPRIGQSVWRRLFLPE